MTGREFLVAQGESLHSYVNKFTYSEWSNDKKQIRFM